MYPNLLLIYIYSQQCNFSFFIVGSTKKGYRRTQGGNQLIIILVRRLSVMFIIQDFIIKTGCELKKNVENGETSSKNETGERTSSVIHEETNVHTILSLLIQIFV